LHADRLEEIFTFLLKLLHNNTYLCGMFRKTLLSLVVLIMTAGICSSQAFIKTAELFRRNEPSGRLNIIQNQSIDTLLSRYIIAGQKQRTIDGAQGMQGYRIQIYYSSVRDAREEAAKARAKFFDKFPDLASYSQYQAPGWFMVRAGDFRTKTEGYKYLVLVRRDFPNAYLVPSIINFPDLIQK
jgi:hypothetical protein